jgi:sulfoxide reductase heme-binding subunit YedZ
MTEDRSRTGPTARQIIAVGKPLVFIAAAAPLLYLLLRVFGIGPGLGPNPIEVIQDELGIGGLRLLLLTLAMSPLAWLIGKPWPVQFRRMLGLFAFAYCALHFANYLVLDQALDWRAALEDVLERPFITVGFVSLLLLVPLAVTSTAGWRQRLGTRWKALHRLVYACAVLACWHFWWQVKKDATEPAVYAVILLALLSARFWHARRRRSATRAGGARTVP